VSAPARALCRRPRCCPTGGTGPACRAGACHAPRTAACCVLPPGPWVRGWSRRAVARGPAQPCARALRRTAPIHAVRGRVTASPSGRTTRRAPPPAVSCRRAMGPAVVVRAAATRPGPTGSSWLRWSHRAGRPLPGPDPCRRPVTPPRTPPGAGVRGRQPPCGFPLPAPLSLRRHRRAAVDAFRPGAVRNAPEHPRHRPPRAPLPEPPLHGRARTGPRRKCARCPPPGPVVRRPAGRRAAITGPDTAPALGRVRAPHLRSGRRSGISLAAEPSVRPAGSPPEPASGPLPPGSSASWAGGRAT
jgi:hypothetical protein